MTNTLSRKLMPSEELLSLRVSRSFAEAEPLHSAWDHIVFRSGANVYQTYDWCRIWWQYYGTQRQLYLLLYYSGDELVGVIPTFIETLWLGPARIRVAKLIGSDFTLNLCNLPVLPDVLSLAAAQAIQYFFNVRHCDALIFGPLSGPASHIDELRAVGTRVSHLVARTEQLGDDCNTFFDFPSCYEDYLKTIDNKQRSNLKRSMAKLSKEHRISIEVVSSASNLEAEYENFIRLHETQWRAAGKLGHFGDWPYARNFNRDIVRTLGAQGMVRFHRIIANDQVISSHLSYIFSKTIHWRLPARAIGNEWNNIGLGSLGLLTKIEASIKEGFNTSDAGRGHYEYKLHLGGREMPLRTIQYVRCGCGVATRIRLFRMCAFFFNIVYYKVIFARLAPRMPVFRHSLWPVWIRTQW